MLINFPTKSRPMPYSHLLVVMVQFMKTKCGVKKIIMSWIFLEFYKFLPCLSDFSILVSSNLPAEEFKPSKNTFAIKCILRNIVSDVFSFHELYIAASSSFILTLAVKALLVSKNLFFEKRNKKSNQNGCYWSIYESNKISE